MYDVKWTGRNKLQNLIKGLQRIDGQHVDIGYFSEQGKHPEAKHLTYPQLMAIHELRSPYDPMYRPAFKFATIIYKHKFLANNDKVLKEYFDKCATTSSQPVKTTLDKIGVNGINMIKPVFGDRGILTPNTPGVAASKGFNAPLIEYGYLKEALAFKTSLRKTLKRFDK